ncbi:hypothetical protein Cob_v005695 [Colletotrichum orbiculare MAFF 240422]|uniref:Uncharacterized protein n=1 Tax=Colletotrichum orbiculare (strain 104-T / ATCC 96160 / CBS 514.97 / LARS 414 / MAFF 240422) TaxID=1213857 RepID=A0A484FTH5_COLOR|nr:hypothetical protein Cob_v005695 [Colletotrichum orbiculare MAFF 240422]
MAGEPQLRNFPPPGPPGTPAVSVIRTVSSHLPETRPCLASRQHPEAGGEAQPNHVVSKQGGEILRRLSQRRWRWARRCLSGAKDSVMSSINFRPCIVALNGPRVMGTVRKADPRLSSQWEDAFYCVEPRNRATSL